MPESSAPDPNELSLLTMLGRIERLQRDGLSMEEAVARVVNPESREAYLSRNNQAMQEAEQRLLSPEYMARWSEAYHDPDPVARERKLADLKRENYSTLDIEAIHRTIGARNRQMKAEGMLPPDAPV